MKIGNVGYAIPMTEIDEDEAPVDMRALESGFVKHLVAGIENESLVSLTLVFIRTRDGRCHYGDVQDATLDSDNPSARLRTLIAIMRKQGHDVLAVIDGVYGFPMGMDHGMFGLFTPDQSEVYEVMSKGRVKRRLDVGFPNPFNEIPAPKFDTPIAFPSKGGKA